MTFFPNLQTADQVAAARVGKPIAKGPTRLETKTDKDHAFDLAWAACCKAVDKRDGIICRDCGTKTVRSLELQPKRAEHAHIVRRRKVSALMTDPRNVLLLCATCHARYDHHNSRIEQPRSAHFEHAGVGYVNADKLLRFVENR